MTNAVSTSDHTTDFLRGHRVRFANGPVMTVMDYLIENRELFIVCGWWLDSGELETSCFHPDILIHTDASYTIPVLNPPEEPESGLDQFTEFYSDKP